MFEVKGKDKRSAEGMVKDKGLTASELLDFWFNVYKRSINAFWRSYDKCL